MFHCERNCCIGYISYPSTNEAQPCLAFEIRWGLAGSGLYGRHATLNTNKWVKNMEAQNKPGWIVFIHSVSFLLIQTKKNKVMFSFEGVNLFIHL